MLLDLYVASLERCEPLRYVLIALGSCGLGWAFVFLPYGAMWRECRKAFQREFHVNAVKRFRPIELHHSRKLLHRLLHSPDRFLEHLKQCVVLIWASHADCSSDIQARGLGNYCNNVRD